MSNDMEEHEHQKQPELGRQPGSADGGEQPVGSGTSGPKRLYRSSTQKMLLGVAGGLGEYFEVDPTLVRIAFILLTFLGGGGLVLYVVLAIIMPSEATLDVHPREAARTTVDEAVNDTRRAIKQGVVWVREKTGRSSSHRGGTG